jgi:hypothetical protein
VESVGQDTVTVTVSDGELSDQVVAIIKRGTRNTSTDLSSYTFTVDRSPWILDPPVGTIRWGNVEIEAGTDMYINREDLTIEVVGNMKSIGTQTDTILVHPNDRNLRCSEGRGWWKGFLLVADGPQSGDVEMAYTHVSYGDKNLYVWQGVSSARVRYSRFVCGGEAGIKMGSNGVLTVDNCDVSDNRSYGVYVWSLSTVPDSVTITNCLIRSNDHTGVALDLRDETKAADITIERNDIRLNSSYGVTMTNAVWATIQHNDFSLNNLSNVSNIVLLDPYPDVSGSTAAWDTLPAIHNYWGRAYAPGEISLIERTIVDERDDPSLGTVILVDPWENTPQAPH